MAAMNQIVDLLKSIRDNVLRSGATSATVEDYIFDAYANGLPHWVRLVSGEVPPDPREHLMFKDIKVYPRRAFAISPPQTAATKRGAAAPKESDSAGSR